MQVSEEKSLGEARDWLRKRVDKGEHCPCCKQFAKVYTRPLNASMALVLCYLNEVFPDKYIHVSDHLKEIGTKGALAAAQSADWAKCAGWGLIEQMKADREDGSDRNGYWRLTPMGREFTNGYGYVPKYVRIYDGRFMGTEGAMITIHDAVGKKFDYYELMQK